MIRIRKAGARGRAKYGWLDTRYTFSFNTYYDPAHMGFRTLRVMNEDFVKPSEGFGTHGHSDMEIITYVIEGELAHKDSTGRSEVLRPHEVQRMTAGTGIRHSEFNPSDENEVHLYQIWILPEENGLAPGYEQTYFAPEEKKGTLRLVASREGSDGSVRIHQDVRLYAAILDEGDEVSYRLKDERHAWLQVVKGGLSVNGKRLSVGDGAAVSEESDLQISAAADGTEFLLFDLN